MARVVVVGGGLAGMAAAARLAKLGHRVTLLEASGRLGGALGAVERDGFRWDAGASSTLLPAVLRDLFRKTGRPLERELELVTLEPVREHRFADGSRLALPGGSRAAQIAAFDALGRGLGAAWAAYVASYADDWDLLRRHYLERPYDQALVDPAASGVLRSRLSLARAAEALPDERVRLVALHHVRAEGHDPRSVPSWLGVTSYLEQRLGAVTVPGGLSRVTDALAARLETRGVEVRPGCRVERLLVSGRVARGVALAGGEEVPADAVVLAADPRQFRALTRHTRGTDPAPAPAVLHLGLRDEMDLAHETVLHGPPDLVVHRGGSAPAGHSVLTVVGRLPSGADPLALLAERGLDLGSRVVTRVDRSAADVVAASGGSPYGLRWDGRRTVRRRLGPATPVAGLYAAGAHATPGAGVPFVGLSAAQVAQLVGPA